MLKKNELLDAIDELEASAPTFQNCQKLATFYLLYDHLYGENQIDCGSQVSRIEIIADYGTNDFLQAIAGADAERVIMVIDELMETVKVLQPRLYDATLTRLKEI